MNRNVSALATAIAASLSATAANAGTYAATLKQVISYSGNGSSSGNISSSTATFTYDDVTGLLTQDGGTFNVRFTITPTTTLFRHSITGLVIGNSAAATATAYTCTEGNFGGGVGASLCGNYNFGANFTNESTASWGPGTTIARTLGGDDMALGPQQNITAYDTFATISWAGTTLTLRNAFCNPAAPGNANGCATTGGFNTGYTWVVEAGPQIVANGVANDDTASTRINTIADVAALANDTGFDDPVTVSITAPPASGTVTILSSNAPCADPCTAPATNILLSLDDSGQNVDTQATYTRTFTYSVDDGNHPVDTADVTVTFTNAIPVANNGSLTIPVTGAAQQINLASIAGNAAGDAPTIYTAGNGASGTTSVSGSTVTYTLNPGVFSGNDTFSYIIEDADGTQKTADVAVTIQNTTVNAPNGTIAINTTGVAPASVNGTVDVDTLAGASLGDGGDTITTSNLVGGTVSVNDTTNVITFTPSAGNYVGPGSFDYTITDSDGETDTGSVTVNFTDSNPALADESVTTTQDTPVDVALDVTPGNGSLANHTISEGLVPTGVSAEGGDCEVTGTTLTYTPAAGFTGTDTCGAFIIDGDGDADQATITITVNPAVTSTGLREDDGGSSMDALLLSLLGASALIRRRRRA